MKRAGDDGDTWQEHGVAAKTAKTRGIAGNRADRQPAARAGIAEIERARRLGETANTDAMDPPQAVGASFQSRAEGAHGLGGMQHVLTFQEAGDRALADRQRA